MFANGKPAMSYLTTPPPNVNGASYKSFLANVKAIGRFDSASRTQDQTDIALSGVNLPQCKDSSRMI